MFVERSEYIIDISLHNTEENTEENIARFVEYLDNAPRIISPKKQTLSSLIQTLNCIRERFKMNDPISPVKIGKENSNDLIQPDTNSLSSLSVTNV